MSKIIGIDLGTTNCVGAFYNPFLPKEEQITVFKDTNGNELLPSVLAAENGNIIVGDFARRNENHIDNVKMNIDRNIPYNFSLLKDPTPSTISSLYLKAIKEHAERALGEPVKRAIITIPAHFHHNQKVHTREAGIKAGFAVEDLIPEPEAAALAYCWKKGIDNETILVYDLGGGTFDATVLSVKKLFCHIAGYGSGLAGDSRLGGSNFDLYLLRHIATCLKLPHEVLLDRRVTQNILLEAERLKKELCNNPSDDDENVVVEFIPNRVLDDNYKDFHPVKISRKQFNTFIYNDIEKTILECKKTVEECRRSDERLNIDRIIMVGGSSRIPLAQRMLENAFGIKPELFDPDLCVAIGAAIFSSLFGQIYETSSAKLVIMPFPSEIKKEISINGFIKKPSTAVFEDNQGKDVITSKNSQFLFESKIVLESPSQNLRIEQNVEKNGQFTFKQVPVPSGSAIQYTMSVHIPNKDIAVGGSFMLAQGKWLKAEQPRMSQALRIKTIDSMEEVLEAGSPIGSSMRRRFYTAGQQDIIRLPVYEGCYYIGELSMNPDSELPPGIPIEVEIGFGIDHQIFLNAQLLGDLNLTKAIKLAFGGSTDEEIDKGLESMDFRRLGANLATEIFRKLEYFESVKPNDQNLLNIRKDVELIQNTIETEVSSQMSNESRLYDCIRKLRFHLDELSYPEMSVENVDKMVELLVKVISKMQAHASPANARILENIRKQVKELELKAKEACKVDNTTLYNNAYNEFNIIRTRLFRLDKQYISWKELCDYVQFYFEQIIRDLNRVSKSKFPIWSENSSWENIVITFSPVEFAQFIEQTKNSILLYHKIINRNGNEQEKTADLSVFFSDKIVPLHAAILRFCEQRGLVKSSAKS